jgi:hypothetical protein
LRVVTAAITADVVVIVLKNACDQELFPVGIVVALTVVVVGAFAARQFT